MSAVVREEARVCPLRTFCGHREGVVYCKHGEGIVHCGHGKRVLQMRTFKLIGEKKLDFSKFMVCPLRQKERAEAMQTREVILCGVFFGRPGPKTKCAFFSLDILLQKINLFGLFDKFMMIHFT